MMRLARCMQTCTLPLSRQQITTLVRQYCRTPITTVLCGSRNLAHHAAAPQRGSAACHSRSGSGYVAAAHGGQCGSRRRWGLRLVSVRAATAAPEQSVVQDEVRTVPRQAETSASREIAWRGASKELRSLSKQPAH